MHFLIVEAFKIGFIMKKFFAALFAILIIINPASAGEVMKKGTVLVEDSYVFTIDEAKGLTQEIARLEKIIKEYKELDEVTTDKFSQAESLIKIKDLQITQYKGLHELDTGRIRKLERRSALTGAERWGLVIAGVGLTIGAVLIADKIDDAVETPAQNNINTQARGIPLVRF